MTGRHARRARPRQVLVPVRRLEELIPGYETLPAYRALVEGMTAKEVEFAKALLVCGGKMKVAAALIYPTAQPTTQKRYASELWGDTRVQSLFDWLRVEVSRGLGPVTLEEIVEGWERDWRVSVDPEFRFRMGLKLIRMRKLADVDGAPLLGDDDDDDALLARMKESAREAENARLVSSGEGVVDGDEPEVEEEKGDQDW